MQRRMAPCGCPIFRSCVDLGAGQIPAQTAKGAEPREHERGHFPEPGFAITSWALLTAGSGRTDAIATCALFLNDPATTWSLPTISASKPSRATSAGSSFFD